MQGVGCCKQKWNKYKIFWVDKSKFISFLYVKIQQDKLKLTMTCQRDTIKGHHADADDQIKIRIKRAQAKLMFLYLTRFKNEIN